MEGAMNQSQVKLNKIGLIMLGVTDMERSLTFYRDLLGMTVQGRHEGFAFLDGGTVTLALSTALSQATGKGAGATEVVFSVPGVTPAFAALQARGVVFINQPRVVSGAMWGANFQDPDGHG